MKIRRATYQDSEQIVSLVKKVLNEFGFTYDQKTSEADIEDIEATYLTDNGTFLVCTYKNKIVATGGLLEINKTTYKVRKMYVDQAHRGIGLGKRMLASLEEEAIRRGAAQLILETTDQMKAAINLYLGSGYAVTSTLTASPRCTMTMAKTLK